MSEERILLSSTETPLESADRPTSIRGRLKQVLGPDWRLRTHRAARLRWFTKYRALRELRSQVSFRTKLAFVLFDPEIESYTYELADEPRLVGELAQVLGCAESELTRYAEETRTDPELNARLRRHMRWRSDTKRHLPLGHRLAWYLIVRARKPELVVETGIYKGLGSLVLLRALERNREDGFPGDLMSFDTASASGELVRPELRVGWMRFVGSTQDLLPPALRGRRIDILFQDTPHTEENQRFEFGVALEHAGEKLLLLDGSGGDTPTLEAMAAENGGSHHVLFAPSRDHVYQGSNIALALFDQADVHDAPSGASASPCAL